MLQRQRPTAALRNDPDPHSGWEELDYKLQDAYFTMDNEKCTICNNPVWLCHSTDNRIDFKVEVRTCHAKAEIESYEGSKKGKDLGNGEYAIAVPIGIEFSNGEHEPLPTRIEAYKSMPD